MNFGQTLTSLKNILDEALARAAQGGEVLAENDRSHRKILMRPIDKSYQRVDMTPRQGPVKQKIIIETIRKWAKNQNSIRDDYENKNHWWQSKWNFRNHPKDYIAKMEELISNTLKTMMVVKK